jgi:TolB-like protein
MSALEAFVFGPFRLSAARRELTANGAPVALGARAFDLLLALVRRNGVVASKDELLAEVWPGTIVEENNLQVQVSSIRKVLGEEAEGGRYLLTVPGRGYRFVAPVERVSENAGPAASQSGTGAPLPLPDKPSIAVLPFSNISGDPEQDYFADGMAEEIITALSRCAGLFVIARNSSFTYKNRAVDIRAVGRELGVRYVLEGSVRRGGDRLRFTGQLIDATNGVHIWADRFDGELSDVFALQDRLTENVVAAIEPSLQIAEIERVRHKGAAKLNAYDHLLRAQQLEAEFTAESYEGALHHLKQARAIDPNYAPALALAGYIYGWRRTQGWSKDPETETNEGLALIARALEFGTFDANVLWMCAYGGWQLGMDDKRVLDICRRSVEINPNSAVALAIAGRTEVLLGNYAKGRELLERAERLNPRDPRGWVTAQGMMFTCLGERKFAEAVAWGRKALVPNPRNTGAMRLLAASLAHLGQVEEARQIIDDNLRTEPDLTLTKFRARRRFMHDDLWQVFAEGLLLAGLPKGT